MDSRAKDGGFTLAELSIALGLVAVTIAGVAQVLVASLAMVREAREETAAVAFASQKLERLRSHPWADLAAQALPIDTLSAARPGYAEIVPANVDGGGEPAGVSLAGGTYVRRWAVAPASQAGEAFVLGSHVMALRRSLPSTRSSGRPLPGAVILITLKAAR